MGSSSKFKGAAPSTAQTKADQDNILQETDQVWDFLANFNFTFNDKNDEI